MGVFNSFNSVFLVIMNPKLVKEVLTPDKVDIYHKDSFILRGMTALMGKGLLLNEGDRWRNKRKIVSKLFLIKKLFQVVKS